MSDQNEVQIMTLSRTWFLLLVMHIPFIGWIFTIYYSIKKGHPMRAQIARATIINKIIVLILFIILTLIILSILNQVDQALQQLVYQIKNTTFDLKTIIEFLIKLKNRSS